MLSNCHEAKYAKVNRTMKDGSKEEFECPVAIEFYNKIIADKIANVYELDQTFCKWRKKVFFRLLMSAVGQLIDCVLQTQASKDPTT
ncbi:rho guanine nucleotide exchange factor 10-like protein [Trichonephila clavata]|uniref:Rho guanine nucleotide exchange factor 10-like protein n=1 Tax=Trichonephila clavata TaxID=2740835 RepID=A0A8X6KMR3_TRICU|nr:rho guanine nucleotide exchange factor 10-like protein [Trichonephila clavata]